MSEREVSIYRRHIVCQDRLVFPKIHLLLCLLPNTVYTYVYLQVLLIGHLRQNNRVMLLGNRPLHAKSEDLSNLHASSTLNSRYRSEKCPSLRTYPSERYPTLKVFPIVFFFFPFLYMRVLLHVNFNFYNCYLNCIMSFVRKHLVCEWNDS